MKELHPKLKMLCNLYEKSNENIDINALLKVCFFNNLGEVLELCSLRQCVGFSYLCAKHTFNLNDEKLKEKAEEYLNLIEKWLENPNSIFIQELKTAAKFCSPYRYYNDINYISQTAFNNICAAICTIDNFYENFQSCYYITDALTNQEQERYKNLGFLIKVIKDG